MAARNLAMVEEGVRSSSSARVGDPPEVRADGRRALVAPRAGISDYAYIMWPKLKWK